MKEKLNSDKQLREKFDDFLVQPPPLVWDNIKGSLALQRRRKRMVYLGWMSAAALVLMAFIAGWYLNNDTTDSLTPKTAEQIIQNEKRSDERADSEMRTNNIIAEVLPEHENEKITELNKSVKTNRIATATKNVNNLNTNTSEPSGKQQIKIDKLERKNTRLHQTENYTLLAEHYREKEYSNLSTSDEFLMASNVNKLKLDKKATTGWKMGMHISPGYSSNVSNHSQSYSQDMNYSSDGGNGNVGGGLSIQYKTSKKFRIESGVYYAQNSQKSGVSNSNRLLSSNKDMMSDPSFLGNDGGIREYLNTVSAPESSFSNTVQISNGNLAMNSSAGVIEMSGTPKGAIITNDFESTSLALSNTLVSSGEFSQVFDFIEIPLYLRYCIIDSKFGLEILGGLNAGIIVGNNAYLENSYGLQNIGKTQEISTVNMSGTVGFGVNYALGKHISIAIEPRLNYYLYSINKSPEVDFRPYRVGFYTGLYYDF